MFRRLRLRLTLVCTAVTGLVLIGMALASRSYSENQLETQYLQSFSSNLSGVYFYIQGQNTLDHAWLSRTEAENGLLICIEDNGRPLLYGRRDPVRLRLVERAQAIALSEYGFDVHRPAEGALTPGSVFFFLEEEGVRYRVAVSSVTTAKGQLSVTMFKDTLGEQRSVTDLRLRFTGAVAISILCLLAFAWFFTARAIRPVEQSRRQQSEFISAASHELRSPLAVMQASAGAMQDAPPQRARDFGLTIAGECVRLSRLVDDLLALAGADSGRWTVQVEPVEPETLLLSTAERFEPVAAGRGQSLQVELPDEPLPRCMMDPVRVDQALSIMLDNAVSYTPTGGRIRIGAAANRRRLAFWVEDSGPGVPPHQRERVFERFYRADASRSKKEHYGLGLSIAREIAQLHRGTLTAGESALGGARFLFTLPIAAGQPQPNRGEHNG